MAKTRRIAANLAAATKRERVRARAKELGILAEPRCSTGGPLLSDEQFDELWGRMIEESRGLGPMLDEEIRADRERM